ncbi:MAG: carbamoyltransferase HypF [Planctomycetota bacterium]|nr:carbamoyltransferase HypF [Planctomycetota bacterium]
MQHGTRIHITGMVQGVGFRPFIYNLASKYNLKGFCLNDSQGVLIEVHGEEVDNFIQEIKTSPPPLSHVEEIITQPLDGKKIYRDFSIRDSLSYEENFTLISPDISICQDCLKELENPNDRRYHYPFINCTNCGPRYSIVTDTPYDRSRTTMASFRMCTDCEREYHDPNNRRFHAQPNACPECGPKAWLIEKGQELKIGNIATNYEAIKKAKEFLKEGAILAIKGLGGFHLACDAANHNAVKKLRERKRKSNKPFALMSPDIKTTKAFCSVSKEEGNVLEGRIRPVVILEKIFPNPISDLVAPGNKNFGVMLPYTPIHSLLFNSEETRFTALVMTSGNQSEEPIVISNDIAIEKLSSIADFFLLHDRDIYMRVDDSIIVMSQTSKAISNLKFTIPNLPSTTIGEQKSSVQVIRRARGFVPEPLNLGEEIEEILACGAELKNTFCLTKGKKAILSQHIGDLENYEILEFFKESLNNLKNSFRVTPRIIAHDLHPDYLSTRVAVEYAAQMNIPDARVISVQHHHAHIVSCMAEHGLNSAVIGVAFDGTGYGSDGNMWGGEFLIVNKQNFMRKAHLQYVPMPSGDKAVREPWRMAISYLYQTFGDSIFEAVPPFLERLNIKDVDIIIKMIKSGINTPLTSSVGRLFDAVSSLLGIRDTITFEGEAAIGLEMAADRCDETGLESYPFQIVAGVSNIINLKPLVKSIIEDFNKRMKPAIISLKFHHTLAKIVVKVTEILAKESGIKDVVLSGGVFQNMLLLKLTTDHLTNAGFKVWSHRQVPTNDGGISLGQAVVAWEKWKGKIKSCALECQER